MTSEQREDLYIKWSFCGSLQQGLIRKKYLRLYGTGKSREHWEYYMAKRLNVLGYSLRIL